MNETKNWKFIGGMLCLDFVNSVGGRKEQEEKHYPENIIFKDKLENYNDLVNLGEADEDYYRSRRKETA